MDFLGTSKKGAGMVLKTFCAWNNHRAGKSVYDMIILCEELDSKYHTFHVLLSEPTPEVPSPNSVVQL